MPPIPSKKRARASNVPPASRKRSRISTTPPLPLEPSQAWEREQLESQPQESIAAPTEGSHAGTGSVATTEAASDSYIDNGGDDFDRLDWDRLGRSYMKLLTQPSRASSWVYAHGYRVVRREQPTRIFWVCKYCHIHKAPSVLIDCSKATSSAAAHLRQNLKGYNLCSTGIITPSKRLSGQLSLREALSNRIEVSQAAANAIGNFSVQRFRYALVL
jgi:hypothetical protein